MRVRQEDETQLKTVLKSRSTTPDCSAAALSREEKPGKFYSGT